MVDKSTQNFCYFHYEWRNVWHRVIIFGEYHSDSQDVIVSYEECWKFHDSRIEMITLKALNTLVHNDSGTSTFFLRTDWITSNHGVNQNHIKIKNGLCVGIGWINWGRTNCKVPSHSPQWSGTWEVCGLKATIKWHYKLYNYYLDGLSFFSSFLFHCSVCFVLLFIFIYHVASIAKSGR